MVELGLLSVADGFDDVGEPGLAVDAVQFGGFDQGVEDGCMIAGPVIAKKQKILPPKNDILHRPLRCVVIDAEAAVAEIFSELFQLRCRVIDCFH